MVCLETGALKRNARAMGCFDMLVDSSNEKAGIRDTERSTSMVQLALTTNTTKHAERSSRCNSCPAVERFDDVENGCSKGPVHVSISITGMTCTGCSRKAVNVLNRMPGISNAKINFITSTGEFHLHSRLNPTDVISQFERETGFKCSQFTRDSQKLAVMMSNFEAKQFLKILPPGIDSVRRVNEKVHIVAFDPTVIGARCVLSFIPSGHLAKPRTDDALVRGERRLLQLASITAAAAGCTVPVLVMAWSDNPIPSAKRSLTALILATCVQAIAVAEFYVGALKSLIFSRVIEMDMLVSISVTAAYGYSVVAFALGNRGYVLEQGQIFETSTLLTTLILLGRLISVMVRMKALTAVSMKSLQAEMAFIINKSGETSELDTRLLEYGDVILIPPHARIVTDGEIIRGCGDVDECVITGETTPIAKNIGDAVIAGTMNGSSTLTIRLTRLPGQNSITEITDLVEGALEAKPRLQGLAETVASWFILVIVGISCIVFAVWFSIGLKVRKHDAGGSVGLAISYSITVLAVSCPCALGLAIPMVLVVAGGVAVRSGIIIKKASVTEGAYRTTDVVFDKTGTLTTSTLEVIEEEYYDQSYQHVEAKSIVLSLLRGNDHPVSSAVTHWLRDQDISPVPIESIQSIPGAGIEASWNGKVYKAGNPYWLGIETHPEIDRRAESGLTVLAITVDSQLIAAYGLKSQLRNEATAVVQDLHRRCISCHIVSGDGAKVVEDVALTLGIDQRKIASRQTPTSKQEYVKRLIAQGKTVLFCGDGTNDAVAVAQAHIGVQIGSTSNVTKATADVVLTGGLDSIPALLDISKQAFIRIVFNFVWSGLYNLLAFLLAAGAFVKVRLPPAYAGLGEIVSVLPVVFVALSLLHFKRKAL